MFGTTCFSIYNTTKKLRGRLIGTFPWNGNLMPHCLSSKFEDSCKLTKPDQHAGVERWLLQHREVASCTHIVHCKMLHYKGT